MKRSVLIIFIVAILGIVVAIVFADNFKWQKIRTFSARAEKDNQHGGVVLRLEEYPGVRVIQDSINEADLPKITSLREAKTLTIDLLVVCKFGLVDFFAVHAIHVDGISQDRFFAPQLCLENTPCGRMGAARPAYFGLLSSPSFLECFR